MSALDEQIDALLVACGNGARPDFVRFYYECDALMSSGVGPRSFCVSIATRLTRVTAAISQFSEANPAAAPDSVDDNTKRERLIAFNGHRLLGRFIAHLPAEMRAFIARESGVPVQSTG